MLTKNKKNKIKKVKNIYNNDMKIKKNLLWTLAPICSLPLVTLTTSCNFSVISFKGSSSMLQYLNDISKELGHEYEMNIVGGGSSTGLSQLIHGKTDFASMSKDPRFGLNSPKKKQAKEEYLENKLKTFLVAKENVAFVLKLPETKIQLSSGEVEAKDLNVYFNKNNWRKLLESFGGQEQLTLSDITLNNDSKLKEFNITPFYKSGGANFSGTAEALSKQNPFLDIKPSEKAAKFLEDTSDKPKYDVKLENDSSNEFWMSMKRYDKPCLGFFTLDFIKKNIEDFKQYNCLVLSYLNPDNNKYYSPLNDHELVDYVWNRGFYLVISLKKNYEKELKFLYTIFDPKNKTKIQKVYSENALTFPTNDEIIANFNLNDMSEFKWPEIMDKVKPDTKFD